MRGTKVSTYQIMEEIGKGGMATVYRAFQPSVGRYVALKVIEKSIADEAGIERFQREARLIARLEHVHIVPVYDFDGTHTPPYIVMRYLEGGTLKDILKKGLLPFSDVAYLFGQIASALDYSHRQGIIHRDIKPSNIMIDLEGNAYVSDFGIARIVNESDEAKDITQAGMAIGTPDYMSPEQAAGEPNLDHRTDIYALGVMLFQMLTGYLPYTAPNPMQILIKHIHEPIPNASDFNPAVPSLVSAVIYRAMEKNPSLRYATAAQLARELREAVGVSISTSPSSIILRSGQATDRPTPHTPTTASRVTDGSTMRFTGSITGTISEHNRIVTVFYLNLLEYSEILAETQDAETVKKAMDNLWQDVGQIITMHGGKVFSQGTNDLLALWGTELSHEDDSEKAILSALEIRTMLETLSRPLLEADEATPCKMGIHTGITLLTPNMETGVFTATGSTVTLAQRVAENANGLILITHDTYRQVRGVFDVVADKALKVRGRSENVATYRVLNAKAKALRFATHGVEGVETALIGRETELKRLQNAFLTMIEEEETQVLTILGEAGVGKSRLLFEFENWSDLRPEKFAFFQGRCSPEIMQRPYALLRDMLSYRFSILDSDSSAVVKEKLEKGVAELLQKPNPEIAHLMGQLVGFDVSDSLYIKGLMGDPQQLTTRARQLFIRFFELLSKLSPIVIHAEDIHLADDASLDVLDELVSQQSDLRLMLVCLARPSFLQRRPTWGSGQSFHQQTPLKPLDKRASRELVKEILKKVANVPKELRDQIVERTEGNPRYMEEVVKMLIEDRVIVKESEAVWKVDASRVKNWRVPPTLIGLLQARLDTLLEPERIVLQRAAVIGRIFYNSAIHALDKADEIQLDDISALLRSLIERGFIFQRETSALAESTEYIFAQSMLREVLYETLLKRQLKVYHTATAKWLIQTAGERLNEYLPLIAEHFELGEEKVLAATYYALAGKRALYQNIYPAARTALEKALELLPAETTPIRLNAQINLGETLKALGENAAAQSHFDTVLSAAKQANDPDMQAQALFYLGTTANTLGQYQVGLQHLEEALVLARAGAKDHPNTLGKVLNGLANTYSHLGNSAEGLAVSEEALKLARELGDSDLEMSLLNRLGILHNLSGRNEKSEQYYKQGLEIAQKQGNLQMAQSMLNNLGYNAALGGDYDGLLEYTKPALELARELGDWKGIVVGASNIADMYLQLNEKEKALPYWVELIATARRVGAENWLVVSLSHIATIRQMEGNLKDYLAYMGFVKFHPTTSGEYQPQIDALMEQLSETVPKEEIQAGLEAGRNIDYNAVIDAYLKEIGQ